MRLDPKETHDRTNRSYSLRCERCQWKFRVPVEQLQRQFCFACESIMREGEGWHCAL